MKRQRIIASNMVHIVFEANGIKHEYEVDVDQPITPGITGNSKDDRKGCEG